MISALPSLPDLVQQSAAHGWLFIPSALLLGVLHGLEPGHSKTMMVAFLVAIRGTIPQAALLAICATISHTAGGWIRPAVACERRRSVAAQAPGPRFPTRPPATVSACGRGVELR